MNESLWVAAKRTFTSLAPGPLIRRVVNELLWVAAKTTFTIPGPWPLSTFSVRGRERVAAVAAKRTFTSPGPWPLVKLAASASSSRSAGVSRRSHQQRAVAVRLARLLSRLMK